MDQVFQSLPLEMIYKEWSTQGYDRLNHREDEEEEEIVKTEVPRFETREGSHLKLESIKILYIINFEGFMIRRVGCRELRQHVC
jgi:hypothetical protein